MGLGNTIKDIREQKGLLQNQVISLCIAQPNYHKIKNNNRNLTVNELLQLSQLFNISPDEIQNYEGTILTEVKVEDKTLFEQALLIDWPRPINKPF